MRRRRSCRCALFAASARDRVQRIVDRLLFALQRKTVGDLSAYGLPRPVEGAMASIRSRGVTPAIIDQEVLDEIRTGAIECVPAVVGLDGDSVLLAGGRREPADAVIAATGYRTGLEDLVGGLGVLDEHGATPPPAVRRRVDHDDLVTRGPQDVAVPEVAVQPGRCFLGDDRRALRDG